ncbi:MAG: outer membrane beta-barrel protein [Flavobacteriales bacterium]|nr:outer membrane beta-barrel protein [Flavobacteriales bacterium]
MKNIVFLIAALLIAPFAFSQNPTAGDKVEDTNLKKDLDYDFDDWQQRKNKHWQGFDIGINTLMYDGNDSPPPGYESLRLDYGRSFYFGLNLFEGDAQIAGEYFKIVSGLGFDFYNFQLRSSDIMYQQNDSLMFYTDSVHSFKNNNMKSGHITAPLLLAFNTSPKNSTSFHIAFGAIFSYRLSGKQKTKYDLGEQKHQYLVKSEMLQNPWKIAATLRLGYGNFHVFANYALTDFWVAGAAPSARSMVIGLKVIPW